jgi:hypothetical protein
MNQQKPAVVLVRGAFAESASWNGLIEQLQADAVRTIAVADSKDCGVGARRAASGAA